MFEVIFLICLALVWIIFAVVQDLRKREIDDWLNFSLIIFALGFRFFYSFFSDSSFQFFYQGLIGFGIFFLLGNLLYYGKIFAGGDAKLMYAMGAIIPFSNSFSINLKFFMFFFILFLFCGALYGLFSTIFLIVKYFKKFRKEFLRQFKLNNKLLLIMSFFGIVFLALSYFNISFGYFGILFFILPYLYLSAKSVDEVCMVKKVPSNKLTEGDWLYKDVKVKNKVIKKDYNGLNKRDISLLKGKKFVLIRQGIPFSPVFLIAFLLLVFSWFSGLWNSFW